MNESHSQSRKKQKLRHVIMEDLRSGDLKRNVMRDLRDLYTFYLDEEERDRLAKMGRLKRWVLIVGWLAKNLFLNLSPARRVLLLISLWFAIQSRVEFKVGDSTIGTNLTVWGFLLILVILMLELRDKLLARNELEVGRAVQLALLPDDLPRVPGWDIWLYTRSANEVGGDLVDYLPIQDDRLGLALGDVSGKGLGAALLMAKLQATLRARLLPISERR
jgi:hypothetical protein